MSSQSPIERIAKLNTAGLPERVYTSLTATGLPEGFENVGMLGDVPELVSILYDSSTSSSTRVTFFGDDTGFQNVFVRQNADEMHIAPNYIDALFAFSHEEKAFDSRYVQIVDRKKALQAEQKSC